MTEPSAYPVLYRVASATELREEPGLDHKALRDDVLPAVERARAS